ncbi:MAG: ABC transporter permease [Verrucomicrobia bacterium]|nr:ABC transporter permease [Verrucomicrobiota bacterium]
MTLQKLILVALRYTTLLLFGAVFLVFGSLSSKFLEPVNVVNILTQSSSTAIVAIGMTFVLLTAGVDLSVGSIMFVAVAVAGKMIFTGYSLGLSICAALCVGFVFGRLNSILIVRFRIMPFIVTLGTLYFGRGFGLWLTETRAMNMPDAVTQLGAARIAGIPIPILIFLSVLAAGHFVLTQTPLGRQIYAVGNDPEAARKAGIRVNRILGVVYVLSGVCAAIGGFVALTQTGAVSPTFGNQKEFSAIAAAVLGGTSLFGGRGTIFPGTVLGAVLIQTVENGLVILNVDPYLYPLVTSAVIFLAVLIDTTRTNLLEKLGRRPIRVEPVR